MSSGPMRALTPVAGGLLGSALCGLLIGASSLSSFAVLILGVALLIMALVLGISSDRLAFVTVGVFVLTITWNGLRAGGGAIGNALMAIAVISVALHIALSRQSPAMPPWLMLAAGGFLLAALLTLMFPPNLELANRANVQQEALLGPYPPFLPARSDFGNLAKFEVSLLIVPLIVGVAGSTSRRCRALLDLWAIGAVVNAAVGVLDYAGIHIAPHVIEAHRSSGLTIHPNYLALGSVLAIPAAMLWLGRSRRWTVAGFLGVAVLVGGVYASGSRAGSVASVIAIVLTAVTIPRLRRIGMTLLPLLGIGLVAVALFTKLGQEVIHQLRLGAGDTSAAGSDFQRGADAQLALAQIGARPVQGVGFSVITDAHVIYLQVLAAGGVIAMASFLVFVCGLAGSARRAWSSPWHDAVAAASVTLGVWLVNGFFDNQVADKYLYVVPGILIALARLTGERQPARRALREQPVWTPADPPLAPATR